MQLIKGPIGRRNQIWKKSEVQGLNCNNQKKKDQIANTQLLIRTMIQYLKIARSQLDAIRRQKGMKYGKNITINSFQSNKTSGRFLVRL